MLDQPRAVAQGGADACCLALIERRPSRVVFDQRDRSVEHIRRTNPDCGDLLVTPPRGLVHIDTLSQEEPMSVFALSPQSVVPRLNEKPCDQGFSSWS
jgi:hypothetical protein